MTTLPRVTGTIPPGRARGARTSASRSRRHRSVLSFIVGNDVELVDAVATWGEYEKVERAGDEVDPTESTVHRSRR